MSVPFNPILSGSFTSNGTSQLITVPADVTKFEVFNLTQFGSAGATTPMEMAWWVSGLAAGSAYLGAKTNGAATIAIPQMITANGFQLILPVTSPTATSMEVVGAPVTITAVTNANPAVVSTGNTTGLVAGSTVVRMTNVTAMQQISSLPFTIGTVVASTSFGLKYLDASGFAAAGTGGSYEIISQGNNWYPSRYYATKITAASSAVITLSVAHNLTVGQLVRVLVPAAFGMTQMNGLLGTITAITTGATNTITLNINSSAFTAFAFPTSATAAAGVSFAQVIPVGEAATSPYQSLLDDATQNQNLNQMLLGSSVVGGSSDVVQWIAYRSVAQ